MPVKPNNTPSDNQSPENNEPIELKLYGFKASEKNRLDKEATKHLEISRSYIANAINAGKAKVNSKKIKKPGYIVAEGDSIEIDLTYNKQPLPYIETVYEDDDCLVINKPSGLLSHPVNKLSVEATAADLVEQKSAATDSKEGIVHRLDRNTSGTMIIAKNSKAQEYLQSQFADRTTQKTYIAIVKGRFTRESLIIDAPIRRNSRRQNNYEVHPNGKEAQTQVNLILATPKFSFVELKPTTGRTHQLRVHLKYINHPIIGDEVYGRSKGQMMLHAYSLALKIPKDDKLHTFVSKIPTYMKQYKGHEFKYPKTS